jgi:hypothetical protein
LNTVCPHLVEVKSGGELDRTLRGFVEPPAVGPKGDDPIHQPAGLSADG